MLQVMRLRASPLRVAMWFHTQLCFTFVANAQHYATYPLNTFTYSFWDMILSLGYSHLGGVADVLLFILLFKTVYTAEYGYSCFTISLNDYGGVEVGGAEGKGAEGVGKGE